MKKTLFTWILMLVTALAVNAQTLTGRQWCTVLNDEDGQGIAVALTFEKNGTCEMLIATQQDMKEDGVPKMDNLKIVTLAAKKLVLKNDDNQEIPFYDE